MAAAEGIFETGRSFGKPENETESANGFSILY
jgi:hypothetical protein